MRQYSDLAFPFSVEEVVSMGRAPHGKRDEHQAIQQVMAQTDCLALAQRDYRQLSGGEQQRVQLARVLAQLWQPQPSPAWLFLDEPTSALDLYHQQHSLRLLRSLTRQQPLGVCCVLHDLNLAALYADRILLLHQGRLVASGTPQEVLQMEILTRWYQADLRRGASSRCRRSTCVNNVKGAIKRPFSSQLEQEISRCLPQSGGSTARSSYSGVSSNGRSRA